MESRLDGLLALMIGLSRSGKSVPIKRAIENSPRSLVFDTKGDYASQLKMERLVTPQQLIEYVHDIGAGDMRAAFMPSKKRDFDLFCSVGFIAMMYKQLDLVCEEIAQHTNPNKATGPWGRLVNQGLAYGCNIYATAQRGAEIDKSVLNNASHVHITRHGTEADQKYIADMLGVPIETIPTEPKKFIQWNSANGLLVEGGLDFVTSRPNQYWTEGVPRFREKGGKRRVVTIAPGGKFKQIDYK